MAENFPNVAREVCRFWTMQIQEAEQTPNKIIPKKFMPGLHHD